MTIPLTARAPVELTPSLAKETPGLEKFKVTVRVPTMLERDSYGTAMLANGVVLYTKNQIRQMALAGVQEIYPADKHEEYSTLLTELWAATDEDDDVQQKQRELLEQIYDRAEAAGQEKPSPEDVLDELGKIVPDFKMDRARREQAQGINSEIISTYPPLQRAISAVSAQQSKLEWMNVRTYVVGWTGLEHNLETRPSGQTLADHEIEYLRGAVGREIFAQISDLITALHSIDRDDEKNLASLLESFTDPIGSKLAPSKASSENGSSTEGSSTPTRASGSPKTTGRSSRSSKTSQTKTAT